MTDMLRRGRCAWLGAAVAVALVLGPAGIRYAGRAQAQSPPVTCAQTEASPAPFAPAPTVVDVTCATIPLDFVGGEIEQGNFDMYSWLIFVALNWPAGSGCVANPALNILTAPPNPVWLTWLQDADVFVTSGHQPAAWCFGASAKSALRPAERAHRLAQLSPRARQLADANPQVRFFVRHAAKAANPVAARALRSAAISPALQGVLQSTQDILVDQNGRWARFTVSLNQAEYGYVIANTLWTKAGQQKARAINFPSSNTATGAHGATEVKAAWKVLGANDDPSHFLTIQAIVDNDVAGDPSPGANPVTLGLVGLHVVQKTGRQPRWIWSTFEQVENDTKSFFNPNCPATQCPPNKPTVPQPLTAQELNATTKQPNYPAAQVVAVTPTSVPTLNATFQKLLQGTPWAYYQLISTQWTGEFGNQPKPLHLGNSVQETFVAPGAGYGCINCHGGAVTTANRSADLSWLLFFGPQQ